MAASLATIIQAFWPNYGQPVQPDCAAAFSLQVPFYEASVWQDFQGEPASTLTLEVGRDGRATQGFQVILGRFIPGSVDTWFVYGLHGDLAQAVDYPQWKGQHAGLDFVAAPGLRVRAAADGRVIFTGNLEGLGGTVIVEHSGGLQTTYASLGTLTVGPGENVYAGQEIGRIGGKGKVASYLHFQLDRIDRSGQATAVNPLRYLDLSGALVPRTDANRFDRGSSDPAKQPDFVWDRAQYIPL